MPKGVYPYGYMDSKEKFDYDQLPANVAFFSKLNNSDISDEEYAHKQNVWQTFPIRELRKYHIYLNCIRIIMNTLFHIDLEFLY